MSSQGKIAIIGSGHVGSHCAMALAAGTVSSEIVLIDKNEAKAHSQALDVSDALSFLPSTPRVRAGSYADCADADIVVVAIGEPRLPGQTRLDLLENSIKMLHELLGVLKPLDLSGPVITITNPADIVADYARRGLALPRSKVFGTGTLLDSARLIRILSEETALSRADIGALAMGEHGDSSMIPFSQISLGGRPFEAFPNLDRSRLLERTRQSGMEVINGKGSTEFGIGQALAVLCRSILQDEKRVLPLSVLLEGEYGQSGVHCGVPCLVGRNGIEEVIELALSPEETAELSRSCDIIRKHIAKAQEIAPSDALGVGNEQA
jgi:L-lactate dehydrogenase